MHEQIYVERYIKVRTSYTGITVSVSFNLITYQ